MSILSTIGEKIKGAAESFFETVKQPFTTFPGPAASPAEKLLASLPYAAGQLASKAWQTVKGIVAPEVQAPIIRPSGTSVISRPEPSYEIPVPQYEARTGQKVPAISIYDAARAFPSTTQTSQYYQPAITKPITKPAITQPHYQPSQPSYSGSGPTLSASAWQPPPPQAPSGAAGTSPVVPYQPTYFGTGGRTFISPTGESGLSGTGGISAHTGLLSSTQAGLGYITPQTTEEEKKKQEIIIPQGATLSGLAKQYGVSLQDLAAANPQITDINRIYAGLKLNIPTPTTPTIRPTTPLGIPEVIGPEGVINLAQQKVAEISTALKSPLAKQTMTDFQNQLNDLTTVLKTQLTALNPVPDEPILKPEVVATDEEQLGKLYALEKQQYEDLQRSLGIPDTIKQYEDTLKEIQATDEAFSAIIKDVQEDPDFPKGLARRRIQTIENERGVRLKALQGKAELLRTTLELKRQEFADRLGITQRAIQRQVTQAEQQRDNARQQIQQFISSGAIADMSDAELQQWATAGGYTLGSLQAIKNSVAKNQDKYSQFITREDEAGNVTIIGIKKNGTAEIVKTFKGIGTPTRGNTLTLSEAQSRGLPLTLVGKSEVEVAQDLTSAVPPVWFRQMIEEKLQQSIIPTELERLWKEFQGEISQKSSKQSAGSGGEIINPFK